MKIYSVEFYWLLVLSYGESVENDAAQQCSLDRYYLSIRAIEVLYILDAGSFEMIFL